MKQTKPTALDKAIEIAGSQEALGDMIGYSQDAVSIWKTKKGGKVPAEAAPKIDAALNGAVTKNDLRPDIYGGAA